jgi:hypothetical protein
LSDIGTHPYVQLYGYRADNTDAFEKPFLLSLFPENGQTAEELKVAIIAAICACSTPASQQVDNGLEIVEGGRFGLGGTLIQNTTVYGNKDYGLAFAELIKFSVSADEIDVTTTGNMDLDAKNLNLKGSTKVSLSSTAKVIEIAQDNYLYFGDSATDGSWRIAPLSGNFVHQLRELGVWVTKQIITP